MRFPYDELALQSRLKDLQIALLRPGGPRRKVLSQEEQAVQDFGRDLFNALLCGEVRGRYDMSLRDAVQQGKGLRLKLRINVPKLAALPWEFLYDPRLGEYLCLSRNTPIVRYLELPQPIQPLTVSPPLCILGMVATPQDQVPLDVRREKERVEEALKDLQARNLVQLTWLEGQTWRDLQRAMRSGPWHIFHFIGHGGFDQQRDEGIIDLSEENGKTCRLGATELARLLSDHFPMRLVLLNSCEGARGSERDIFSSTAAILVRRGIPAVLAMQYEITDRAAIEFARAFYEALADGLPVDTAVTEARKAVSLAVPNTVEWGVPVLHMRAPDGVLFNIQQPPEIPRKEESPHRESEKYPEEEPRIRTPPWEAPQWVTEQETWRSIRRRSIRLLIVCGGSGIGLLGQRSVLGVHAELQIDAVGEIRIRQQRTIDPFSQFIELDRKITIGSLFDEMSRRIRPDAPLGQSIVYLNEEISHQADIRHLEFLMEHSAYNVPLERGLAQSPAIGGLTIRHPWNREALENALIEMTAQFGIGPERPVEVWIISSTAGGTGEGAHRFVGAFLADFVRRRYVDTPVTLNFIRVGQLTYHTVNFRQTALNTFFGVAADAAFAFKMREGFPDVWTQWFYMDLPDVGTGERSIPVRAQLVEMAAKSVMQEELQDDLQKLLVNNRGIPMILTRTGYWGKDFGEQRKYYETLRQLREKLRALIEPDYERRYIGEEGRQPRFQASQKLEDWRGRAGNAQQVLRRMEGGWQFPRYRVRGYPQNLDEVRALVEEWKRAVSGLVGEDWEELQAEWLVERVRVEEGAEWREMVPLWVAGIGEAEFGHKEWLQRINDAQEMRAWAWYLLGCDLAKGEPRRGGLVERLLRYAKYISDVLYEFNPLKGREKRAQDAAGLMREFVVQLVMVDVLLQVENKASELLEAQLSDVHDVLKMADAEYERIEQATGVIDAIRAADLSDPVENTTWATWLQLLREAARQNDQEMFRRAVLRGATGLTEAGLREVLGLWPQASVINMHREMAYRMGRMYGPSGDPHQAPWWAATRPAATLEYEYRILPWLSPELQAVFQSYILTQQTRFRYIFTKMGRTGLYVLAFSGISLTQRAGDTVTTPAFLIKPFVPQLREALAEWRERPIPNKPSGQLRLVSAGVGGEPLYLPALREAGLTDEELEKIGEFYQFYE